jgi:hypothetical protein
MTKINMDQVTSLYVLILPDEASAVQIGSFPRLGSDIMSATEFEVF